MALLRALESDPQIEIVDWSLEDYQAVLNLFGQRPDKEWGLMDCFSFVVMQRLEITLALTADHHFNQAGFQALLLE